MVGTSSGADTVSDRAVHPRTARCLRRLRPRRRQSRACPTATHPGRSAGSARCRTAGRGTGPTTESRAGRWDTAIAGPWCCLAAADQPERDLRVGLRGALLEAVPLQESQAAAIVAAADLRIQRAVG